LLFFHNHDFISLQQKADADLNDVPFDLDKDARFIRASTIG
jgi:hypothetical protein